MKAIKTIQEELAAADEKIGKLRVELKTERERFEPTLMKVIQPYRTRIADLIATAVIHVAAAAEGLRTMEEFQAAAGAPMARSSDRLPNVAILCQLAEELRK